MVVAVAVDAAGAGAGVATVSGWRLVVVVAGGFAGGFAAFVDVPAGRGGITDVRGCAACVASAGDIIPVVARRVYSFFHASDAPGQIRFWNIIAA